MESSQVCWAAPVLEVDELRLPLSLWSVLRGEAPIQNIEANTVKLTLREEIKNCDQQEQKKSEQKPKQNPW